MSGRALRIVTGLTGLAGLAVVVILIAYYNIATVAELLIGVGWGVAVVIAVHAAPMTASALAWHAITRTLWPGGFKVILWARLVREAAGNLLPVAQIGSDVVGARILAIHGARAVDAGASVLVDLTLEFLTQIAFIIIGLLLFVAIGGGEAVRWVLFGLAMAVPAAAGFLLAQRAGLFILFERLLERMAKQFGLPVLGSLAGLHETTISIYRRRRVLGVAAFWHLVSWGLGAVEVWLILRFLGADVGLYDAFIIESLGQAVRSAAFLVPGAFGVQEGGFVVIGVMFGLGPEIGLSVSLVKRIRDVVLGVPALLAWQAIEGRRLFEPTAGAEDKLP
jgi:putative membrane protein